MGPRWHPQRAPQTPPSGAHLGHRTDRTMTTPRYAGRIALVTGAGRGIGRAIALRLAAEGADLVVDFFRNRQPAEETAEAVRALGRRALVVRANVGDLPALEAMFQAVRQEYGALDFLISSAASGYNRPALEQTVKGWDWTMNINARSLLFAAQQAVPLMQGRGGRMVAISSPGAGRVLPEYVVVGASKAALEALVRYLSVELSASLSTPSPPASYRPKPCSISPSHGTAPSSSAWRRAPRPAGWCRPRTSPAWWRSCAAPRRR
jgi:NADP-dependent 3-hydroxy acid dehydrogenase YdfG